MSGLHSVSPLHSHACVSTESEISGLRVLFQFQGVLLLVRLVRSMLWDSFADLTGALPEMNLTWNLPSGLVSEAINMASFGQTVGI